MTLLIGVSIILQAICAIGAGWMCFRGKNGSCRFWLAMMIAFVGIIVRRSIWLLDDMLWLTPLTARWVSIAATYLVSLAFLSAMTEAIVFHNAQRRTICCLSKELLDLERRLEEREHGQRLS